MAPVGISLVNLLIESSSLSCLTEDRQAEKFAQNSSSSVYSKEPSTSTSNTTNLFFQRGIGAEAPNISSTSSSPTFSEANLSSSPQNGDGTNLNNNNYFSGTSVKENSENLGGSSSKNNFKAREPSPSFSPAQKLYTVFWEKFKRSYNQEEVNSTSPFARAEHAEKEKNKGEDFKNSVESVVSFDDTEGSSAYKKFYEGAKQINRQLLPLWTLLSYPSDLHFYGRAAVMTVVTGLVIEKTLEKLPDIEQLEKRYGPYVHCNVLDGTDPVQPGKIGVDKDFF